ncbi:MAG: translesion error-prone DNA polymerase V autoproteolytic subunit [Deltaproteobacteria bacterium]|nr:MAG: translesion error-prone DNA polymerase V autoproteolytic subunit [Deltaproteobacteria bacterium]
MKKHGGARENAGRPRGVGPHGEATKPVRIPLSLVESLGSILKSHKIPLYSGRVSAGRPLESDNHVQEYVNLYKKLVPEPESIFCVKAQGDSMVGAGIYDGDLLIVDRHEEAGHKKIVIASVNGEQTVKTLLRVKGQLVLMPQNEKYPPLPITPDMEFSIQGVVKHCVRSFS